MAPKTPKLVPHGDVRDAMARFGAGEIDAEQAAELVRPAYDEALAERDARTDASNAADPDDASTPNAFTGVSVARQTGVITPEQYNALGGALVTATGD